MIARDNLVTARANRPNSHVEATHPSSEMRGMFGALERLGYDIDSLLASVGLSRSDVEDPDTQIPGRACAAILANAYRQRLLKNLPLRLAVETPIGSNPLLDYVVASSETIGEGLRRLSRYLRLVNPAISIELCDREEPVRVLVESPGDPFGVELTVSLSVLRMRGETNDALTVEAISFRHEPEDAAEFARLLGCPVHTRSTWNGWALSGKAWQLPMRRSDPVLLHWLERKAAHILARQSRNQSAADEVRRILAGRMAGGDLRIQVVALSLATTPRTLQRRLAAEGTSYDALRDAMRKEAAETFLADSTLSIGEVAYLLGFSESAAFHRAFKRWYGTGPQTFRDLRHDDTNIKYSQAT